MTQHAAAGELVARGAVDALLCALAHESLAESQRVRPPCSPCACRPDSPRVRAQLEVLEVVAALARQNPRAAQRLASAQHAPMLVDIFAGRVTVRTATLTSAFTLTTLRV